MKNTEAAEVTVYNTQIADGEKNSICENGNGTVREKDGVLFVKYRIRKNVIMVKAEADSVLIRRNGHENYTINCAMGETTDFVCLTPYGKITGDIATDRVIVICEPTKYEIKVEYTLYLGGDSIDNRLVIKVKRRNITGSF